MRSLTRCVLAVSLLSIVCSELWSQTTATVSINGVVYDENRAAIPGARVSARNEATNQIRTTTTSDSGTYLLGQLPPGRYELTVEAAGFARTTQPGIELPVGQAATIDVPLRIGALGEAVTVTAKAPLIEETKSEQSQVIEQKQVQGLPVNGRNFIDFTLLTPNVSTGRSAAALTTQIEQGLTFGGQRGTSNNITVDGGDANDGFNGGARAFVSLEAVQEFRVVNSAYTSEFGRAMGGLVNVVTKSGTNDFIGSAFYFQRDDSFDERQFFAIEGAEDFRQDQFGATLGGPIRPDRAFFFGSYEGQRREQAVGYSPFITRNLTAINDQLVKLGEEAEDLTLVPRTDYDQVTAKVDYLFAGSNSLSGRYLFFDGNALGETIGGANLPSGARDRIQSNHSLLLTDTALLSARTTNEARYQFSRYSFDQVRVSPRAFEFVIPGLLNHGHQATVDARRETRHQITDNVSFTAGNHAFRAGVDINFLEDDFLFATFMPPRVVFAGEAGFFARAPFTQPTASQVILHLGRPDVLLETRMYGVYVQDQWQAFNNLVLNYGVRYDYEDLPGDVWSDTDNIQPRAGFAYSFGGDRKTVIRGGAGRYTDKFPILLIGNVVLLGGEISPFPEYRGNVLYQTAGNGPSTALFNLLRTLGLLEVYPGIFNPPPTTLNAQQLVQHLPEDSQNPEAIQASFEIERQILNDLVVSLSYLYVRGSNLPGGFNSNLQPPELLPNGVFDFGFRVKDPRFSAVQEFTLVGKSRYQGTTLTINKRFGGTFGLGASYTNSEAKDDSINLSTRNHPQNDYNLDDEWALSNEHVRHRFTGNLLFEGPPASLLRGFSGGLIVTYQSGRPFNVTAGFDLNRNGNSATDRPIGIGRNTFIGPDYASVDLRLARRFRVADLGDVQLIAEVFNLFDRVNFSDVITVAGRNNVVLADPRVARGSAGVSDIDYRTPLIPGTNFGVASAAFDPRQIQFGVKISF